LLKALGVFQVEVEHHSETAKSVLTQQQAAFSPKFLLAQEEEIELKD